MTAAELDRESQQSHMVHISCHDNGVPAMTSHRALSVVIGDVNDNKPMFTRHHYTGRHTGVDRIYTDRCAYRHSFIFRYGLGRGRGQNPFKNFEFLNLQKAESNA